MNEKIFAEGIRFFPPGEKAPDYIIGTLVITPNDLIGWLKNNSHLLKEYKDKKQLRLNVSRSKDGKGINASVDTWEPKEGSQAPANFTPKKDTDLPF